MSTRITRSPLTALLAGLTAFLLAITGLTLTATAAYATPGDVSGATLSWGVDAGLRAAAGAEGGSVQLSGVSGSPAFGWSGGSGSYDQASQSGTVAYPGSVGFLGEHDEEAETHGLDLTLSNLRIVVEGGSAQLVVDAIDSGSSSSGVVFATIDLSGLSVADGVASVTQAPATLTAAGAALLGGTPGAAIDPVSFSWPVEQAAEETLPEGTETGFSTFSDASVPAGNVESGSVSWSISSLLGRTLTGFPGPKADAYVAPASFTAGSPVGVSTWGGGSGSVASDGSASLAFGGTSVNHTGTGGGWLRLADLQAELDSDGNGVVSALASYGTSAGPQGNRPYDPEQAPLRGPVRVNVVQLSGNTAAQLAIDSESATWSDLAGSWHSQFIDFVTGTEIPGVSAATAKWDYDTAITGATATTGGSAGVTRTPAPISFSLGLLPPPPVAVTPVVTLSASPASGSVQGSAVVLTATVAPATAGAVQFKNGASVLGTVPVTDSNGTAVLSVSTLPVGAHSLVALFTPVDDVNFTSASSPALPFEVFAPVAATPGFLNWGVKGSFRSYVTTIAHGTVTVGNGAGAVGGVYRFPQSTGSSYSTATGLGAANYRGSVTFYGHDGALALTLSSPVVRVTGASSAVLSVVASGVGRVDIATLNLAAGGRSVDATGAVTYTNVPATLTAAGAPAFAGFYSAGESLDPVSFVIGSAAAALAGGVVSSTTDDDDWTPPAEPPATEGLGILGNGGTTEGGEITVTGDGFQPDEEGIKVVVYSTPIVLERDLTADANGVATWSGKLPAGLIGQHTLTFQGSVNRGIVLDIAAATTLEGCVVEDATLSWGFKESFRSYLSGSIAHGEWQVLDGAAYETPLFEFVDGTGAIDADSSEGQLDFTGGIRFTGHGGVLDTTVANPRIVLIDAETAQLLLDVSGTTQEGEEVTAEAVVFADLDLAAATRTAEGGVLSIAGIPAVLTAAGAEAFGTYPAGEELDPVTITATLADDCGEVDAVGDAPGDAVEQPDDAGLLWLWILLAVVLLAVIAVVVTLVVRRRAAA